MIDLEPLFLTFKLALITTTILFILAIPICYWLTYSNFRFKSVFEVMFSLPFVLPPSVLGFYLLFAFSPNHFLGAFLNKCCNVQLVFTFTGLVVASIIYSLPFMVNPLLAGMREFPRSIREASLTLSKSNFTTLIRIVLPNMKTSLLTGIVMTFAHTLGEFGVVIMIGGSIPGQTKVVSIAIYDDVQAMNYGSANLYAGILFAFTFIVLFTIYFIRNKKSSNFL